VREVEGSKGGRRVVGGCGFGRAVAVRLLHFFFLAAFFLVVFFLAAFFFAHPHLAMGFPLSDRWGDGMGLAATARCVRVEARGRSGLYCGDGRSQAEILWSAALCGGAGGMVVRGTRRRV
jgi:hypothetical protein